MSGEPNWKRVHEHYVELVNEERRIERTLIRDVAEGLRWAYEHGRCRSCGQVASHADWCLVGKAQAAVDELLREGVATAPSPSVT